MNVEFITELKDTHVQPQMARIRVKSLDGIWKCNDLDIVVPFPPESDLANYEDRDICLSEKWDGKLTYKTTFVIPEVFDLPRILLHFGAVDQIADVYVDDKFVGHHEGGYLKFKFDITEALSGNIENSSHELKVEVTDTLSHAYPYGKQRIDRGGMWYTKVSGIWKSVWLENVPDIYIDNLKMTNTLSSVDIEACMSNGVSISKHIDVEEPINWTLHNPHLYPVKITEGEDEVYSYFALRVFDEQMINGYLRTCLNGKPIFMHGVLSQGYWPDGIYRPNDLSQYDDDILRMKELGFNMLRVHCKIEDDYFYTACDRLGMLVCQDMVNSGGYHYWRDTIWPTLTFKRKKDTRYAKGKGIRIEPRSQWRDAYDDDFRREFFIKHCKATIDQVRNNPCVVVYTIFNEGWGQFDSDKAYEILKVYDSSRLFDSTSGWFAQKKSDFDSYHVYFWYKKLKHKYKPMFLKECGGYSLPIPGHIWHNKTYGYGSFKTKEDLTAKISDMYEHMVYPKIPYGLCGCIYTQLSDVEEEINGMYTYDRQECKVIKTRMQQINARITSIYMKSTEF